MSSKSCHGMFKKYNKAISAITMWVMVKRNGTFEWIDLVFFFLFLLPVKPKQKLKSCDVAVIQLKVKTNYFLCRYLKESPCMHNVCKTRWCMWHNFELVTSCPRDFCAAKHHTVNLLAHIKEIPLGTSSKHATNEVVYYILNRKHTVKCSFQL